MDRSITRRSGLSRRESFGIAVMAAGALGGCGLFSAGGRDLPGSPGVRKTGETREHLLRAAPLEFEDGGRRLPTWGYEGGIPGPEIRLKEGDTLRVRLRNELPEETTVHWHGLPVPNAMDGVPGVPQQPVRPGEEFVYELVVPAAGTYIYRSHVGLQLDRGLYGTLIVEPAREDLDYDREYVLALDDWLDGAGGTPEDALGWFRDTGGMGGASLEYPLYLVNGRAPEDPETLAVQGRAGAAAPSEHLGGNRLPVRGRRAPPHRHPHRRAARRARDGGRA